VLVRVEVRKVDRNNKSANCRMNTYILYLCRHIHAIAGTYIRNYMSDAYIKLLVHTFSAAIC
jgi:hypothetical protein